MQGGGSDGDGDGDGGGGLTRRQRRGRWKKLLHNGHIKGKIRLGGSSGGLNDDGSAYIMLSSYGFYNGRCNANITIVVIPMQFL
ncbi:hypothetical protein M0804_012173 [Polistes exclamans]|nr:hypothetical protein M0804_012173 [Polistes exclamans]